MDTTEGFGGGTTVVTTQIERRLVASMAADVVGYSRLIKHVWEVRIALAAAKSIRSSCALKLIGWPRFQYREFSAISVSRPFELVRLVAKPYLSTIYWSHNALSTHWAFLTMQAQRRFAFALGLVSASQAPLQSRVVCLAKLVC